MNEKTLITIPEMHAEEGESAVTFLNAPFTSDGKDRFYPDKFFGEWLYHQLFEKSNLFAEKKGFFFQQKRHVCPACGQELNPDFRKVVETVHQLKLKELPAFTVKVSVPSVTCPSCGHICGIDMEGRASRNLVDAILKAFAAEHIQLKP